MEIWMENKMNLNLNEKMDRLKKYELRHGWMDKMKMSRRINRWI